MNKEKVRKFAVRFAGANLALLVIALLTHWQWAIVAWFVSYPFALFAVLWDTFTRR